MRRKMLGVLMIESIPFDAACGCPPPGICPLVDTCDFARERRIMIRKWIHYYTHCVYTWIPA